MIFYHFTRPECLPVILQEGLLVSKSDPENSCNGKLRAVWLTTKPSLAPTLQEKEAMLKTGFLCQGSMVPAATVGLRVKLTTRDRKLKNYRAWMRKKMPWDQHLAPQVWWMYLGDIAPACLEFFKHVPECEPHLELPAIREAYLAGAEVKISPEVRAEYLTEAGND